MAMATEGNVERRGRGVPRLELPFVVMGLVAGWISGRALASPLGPSPSSVVLPATLCGAVAGLLVGTALRRELVLGGGLRGGAFVLVVAGALAGAVAGGFLPYSQGGHGVWIGAICGLAFAPIALLVMAAAQRAGRARLGSIMASADRRAIWMTLGATMAVASLVALPEWSPCAQRELGAPWVTVAMAWVMTITMGWLAVLDWRAWRRVGSLREQAHLLQSVDGSALEPVDPEAMVDLGLGDSARASLRGGAAYRDRLRASSLVMGDPDDAHGAMRRALRRDVVALALGVVVSAAHAVAIAPLPPSVAPAPQTSEPPRSSAVVAERERFSERPWGEREGMLTDAFDRSPSCDPRDPLCGGLYW